MKKSLALTFILILSLGGLLGYSTNKIICAKKLDIMQQENELLKKKLQIANKNLSNKNNKNFTVIYNPIEKSIMNSYWEKNLPKYYSTATNDLINKSLTDTKNILGDPYIIIKNSAKELKNKKEFWIYMPNKNKKDTDNSALYINFTADVVTNYKIDDFNGIDEENITQYLK